MSIFKSIVQSLIFFFQIVLLFSQSSDLFVEHSDSLMTVSWKVFNNLTKLCIFKTYNNITVLIFDYSRPIDASRKLYIALLRDSIHCVMILFQYHHWFYCLWYVVFEFLELFTNCRESKFCLCQLLFQGFYLW